MFPNEKNHVMRMAEITTVWEEMELSAPNTIEEYTTYPVSPSFPVGLLNKNLILNLSHNPSQNLNTSLPLLLTYLFDPRQQRDIVFSPSGNDDPFPVMSLSYSFYS